MTGYKRIEAPGAVQAAVRIGKVLFSREHEDFVGMQVVATVLGGYFGSRLVKVLREERGYTYGVMAAMVNLKRTGYLAVATEVGVENAEEAVELIFGEVEKLRREEVSGDELEGVKRTILGEVARIMDGPFGVVDVVIESVQVCGCGTPKNYLEKFVEEVKATTPARVRELAEKYLSREGFKVVVVG